MENIHNITIIETDLDTLTHEGLLQTAKGLRKAYLDISGESKAQKECLQRIQNEHNNQRILSFGSSISSIASRPSWIRAELDAPDDISWGYFGCFGERIKHPIVVAYEPGHSSLKTVNRKTLLKEDRIAIYSRLPSRRASTIYVFVESISYCANSASRRFRMSAKEEVPQGFVPHWTIHLNRLDWKSRVGIWTGEIRWLYIVLDHEPSQKSSSIPPGQQ